MQFTHEGIEVIYNANSDHWEFELRGRHRTAPTPAKAKEYIDKEPAPEKAKKFPRFKAYRVDSYKDAFPEVEVTNIAESFSATSQIWPDYWINTGNKAGRDPGREKCNGMWLVEISPANAALIQHIKVLNEKNSELRAALSRIKNPEGF